MTWSADSCPLSSAVPPELPLRFLNLRATAKPTRIRRLSIARTETKTRTFCYYTCKVYVSIGHGNSKLINLNYILCHDNTMTATNIVCFRLTLFTVHCIDLPTACRRYKNNSQSRPRLIPLKSSANQPTLPETS